MLQLHDSNNNILLFDRSAFVCFGIYIESHSLKKIVQNNSNIFRNVNYNICDYVADYEQRL